MPMAPAGLAGGCGRSADLLLAAAAVAAASAVGATVAWLRSHRRLQALQAETAQLYAGLPLLLLRITVAADGGRRHTLIGGHLAGSQVDVTTVLLPGADLAPPDEPGALSVETALAQAGRDGKASADFRLFATDGSVEWLRVKFVRLHQGADGGFEVAGYVTSVTAEREATRSLLASGRLSAMGELAGGLVHELRQPLAAIAMAAENAEASLDNGEPEGVRRKLDRIAQQTARAGTLIEHLRRFARGRDMEPAAPVPLDQVLAGAVTIAGEALRESRIDLQTSLGEPPPVVLCQMLALEQVFVNLLVNARDVLARLPPGAPRRICVSASTQPSKNMVVVTFADTGGGIAPGVMRRLFEPFVTTKGIGEGTGLGLAICRRLMDAMAGGITAFNSDEGAVFTVSLPAGQL